MGGTRPRSAAEGDLAAPSPPVRVGLVGCGRIAERAYVPALAATAATQLAAVADPEPDRCRRVAPGVPAFADATALLAGADVELVVVASPPRAHLDDALAAAEAGVVALVEKPPATDAASAARLAELEPPPWIGFNRRFEPGVAEARARVRAGEEPLDVAVELSILPAAWGAYDATAGALLDLGPHAVDLARWVVGGTPSRVRPEHVDDRNAVFHLELGASRARIDVSHARPWRERLIVRDAQGRALVQLGRGGLFRRVVARAVAGGESPLVASVGAQLEALARLIREGRVDPRLSPAADAVIVMSVLDAVTGERREWIDLTSGEPVPC